jgi:hypothetical protein
MRRAGPAMLLLLTGWASDGIAPPVELDPESADDGCRRSAEARPVQGRAIGALDRAGCERALRAAGVAFAPAEAEGVDMPIRLEGPVGGVRVEPSSGDAETVHSILDCRLAVALLEWAPDLRSQQVAAIEHVSIYRPGAHVRGSRRTSGHAHGLAIDALHFVLDDGTRLSVLEGWIDRTRGADPCAAREADDPGTARMRAAVCAAVQRDVFQVVLTPHHDAAHANHVHLEVRPGVDWSFVR